MTSGLEFKKERDEPQEPRWRRRAGDRPNRFGIKGENLTRF